MKRIVLRERGRIHRLRPGRPFSPPNLDACWLDERAFDRLMAHDRGRQAGSIFDWRVDEARAGPWVGVIQLPGLTVELLPKIDDPAADDTTPGALARDNLLVMLAEAGKVPMRSDDLATLDTRRASLHEILVLLFARRLRSELLRGTDRGYVSRHDDLRRLRGKLVIHRQVASNAARRERFSCQYEDFTDDTGLNRLLKATCRTLLQQGAGRAAHEALSNCLLLLDDVTDVWDARPLLDRVVLTRQNERFADLLTFCRLVLEEMAPTAASGRHDTFSLLFDMDRVFEGFITATARHGLRRLGDGSRIYPQARTRRRFLMTGERGGILHLRPDILIEGPRGRLVIDTKWKRLGPSTATRQAGLSAADLYQLYAYTRRYAVDRSLLLFPHAPGCVDREFQPLGPDGAPDGSGVALRFARLHRRLRLRSEREALIIEIAQLIDENLPMHGRHAAVIIGVPV